MTPPPLERVTRLHKALGHPSRLRILAMLRSGELCVCQITAVLRLAPSTVSAHLAELRAADLVRERRFGRWVHYGLAGDAAARAVCATMWPRLARDPRVRADRDILRHLRQIPVEELCAVETEIDRIAATAGARSAVRSRP